jgi:phage gp46-like protein
MKPDRTQGDLLLSLGPEGADVIMRGGQPQMDAGLGSAVIMSLFTKKGWCGDSYLDTSNRFNGRFMELSQEPITLGVLARLQKAAEADLKWMTEMGVAKSVIVRVTNPESRKLELRVIVIPPAGSPQGLRLSRYGNNWQSQHFDPNLER